MFQYRKREACLDFTLTQFVIYALLLSDSPYLEAVALKILLNVVANKYRLNRDMNLLA